MLTKIDDFDHLTPNGKFDIIQPRHRDMSQGLSSRKKRRLTCIRMMQLRLEARI